MKDFADVPLAGVIREVRLRPPKLITRVNLFTYACMGSAVSTTFALDRGAAGAGPDDSFFLRLGGGADNHVCAAAAAALRIF